jgi:hypothetical protein
MATHQRLANRSVVFVDSIMQLAYYKYVTIEAPFTSGQLL